MSNNKSYIDAGLTLFDGFYKVDNRYFRQLEKC